MLGEMCVLFVRELMRIYIDDGVCVCTYVYIYKDLELMC